MLPHERKSLTWLHISDFHFKAKQSFDRDLVLAELLKSIERFQAEGRRPDLIFCTGDIGNTGAAAEYEQATPFFDRLLEITKLPKERIYIVPGNHDVDREIGSQLKRTLISRSDADGYFSQDGLKLHISLKQKNFADWYDGYFDGIRRFDKESTCQLLDVAVINGCKLKVALLNTAVFSQDDFDHGKLWLGRPCMRALADKLSDSEQDFVVALMHHPLDWLCDEDQPTSAAALRTAADVILRGHLHSTDVEQIAGLNGASLHLAAGAAYQTSERPNRAMYVTLDGGELEVFPIRYENDPVPVWTLDASVYPTAPYTRRYTIPQAVAGAATAVQPGESDMSPAVALAKAEFEGDLFETPNGDVLYAEPRLMAEPQEAILGGGDDATPVSVEDIVASSDSYIIEASPEHGASNLARRIAFESSKLSDCTVFFEKAPDLPSYRNKLAPKFPKNDGSGRRCVLILDDFSSGRHDRLLKELVGLGVFSRIIIFVSDRELRQSGLVSGDNQILDFKRAYLWPLGRAEIRALSAPFFASADTDLISNAVDKVYSDLLALCIPLTPANVVMYLRILHRDDDFYPVNRVDILDRYLSELLRRPSDSYKGAFNSKNKIEIVCAFVADIYERELGSFTDYDWHQFCRVYGEKTLSTLDSKSLLEELLSTRIFVEHENKLYLKYSFFYSFFLGRYIALRPERVREFVDKKQYYDVANVVEVVTGLGVDNTHIVQALCDELQSYIDEFRSSYLKPDFNPFSEAKWVSSDEESEKFWAPIEKQIEQGPREAKDIDIIKSSLSSEVRTADQEVRFEKFEEVKERLFASTALLCEAVKNSDSIDGELKRRAVRLIFDTHFSVMQLGTIMAPAIAQHRIVRWGGLVFLNEMADADEEPHKKTIRILNSINDIISRRGADYIGTTKLGEVFKSFNSSDGLSTFDKLINFYCIVASKPPGWVAYLRKSIEDTDKNSFYLHGMLRALMQNFRNDVNHQKDRTALKELIALVRAKREFGRNSPGSKVVSDMLQFLEKTDQFSGKKPADTALTMAEASPEADSKTAD